jgi:hypothetical protein
VANLSLGVALALGLRALARTAWLTPVGLLVTLVRRGLAWPALAVAGVLLLRGAVTAARAAPFEEDAAGWGMALVASSPRFLALVLGLALAGGLLGLLLRLAWLAGALPTLAAALGPAPDPTPRFADGVAHVLPRLLPLAALVLVMETAGVGFGAVLALTALRVSAVVMGSAGPAWLAAPVALALVLALGVPLALSVIGDAALVRAAVRGEGPATALARGTARFVGRPSVLLLGGLIFAALTLAAAVALSSLGDLATGFAGRVEPLLLVGPQLMLAALAATVLAAMELWWLASLAALVTHEG